MSLSACYDAQSDIDRRLAGALKPHQALGAVTTVDLASILPGDWTRTVIVCPGATQSDLDEALGFHWDGAKVVDPHGVGNFFVGMILVANSRNVVDYENVGHNDFIETSYYITPCATERNGDPGPAGTPAVIAIPRSRSKIEFSYVSTSADRDRWRLTGQELSRLMAIASYSSAAL